MGQWLGRLLWEQDIFVGSSPTIPTPVRNMLDTRRNNVLVSRTGNQWVVVDWLAQLSDTELNRVRFPVTQLDNRIQLVIV